MESSAQSDSLQWSRLLFEALDRFGDGQLSTEDIRAALASAGLRQQDPRISNLFEYLSDREKAGQEQISLEEFESISSKAGLILSHALRGNLVIPDFEAFSEELTTIYHEVLSNTSGEQADYIPPLREVNPDRLGVAVVTVDGQVFRCGDAYEDFSIQSTCKPFNYCFAVEEFGAEKVHKHVGSEPSGRPFNAHVLQPDSRPHNPMINAGAIMSAALIQSESPVHRRLEHVRHFWSRLTGGSVPRFNAWMSQEERRTGDNNRALAYMMKARHVFPNGEDASDHQIRDALDLYFSTCSLEMNCYEMAMSAATLANGGVCPTTQERVLSRSTVRNCLSFMQMCGMYEYSGEFCFKIGVPAKSGVGGAVILSVPSLMGVCIWSPRLDNIGNSVRGIEIATKLIERYTLHLYDRVSAVGDRIDPRVPLIRSEAVLRNRAVWAASTGDVWTLRQLSEDGIDLNLGDYDNRTALHVAAAEGHLEVVEYLLAIGVELNSVDRWKQTPLNDAYRGAFDSIIKLLEEHGGEQGQPSPSLGEDFKIEVDIVSSGDPEITAELIWSAYKGSIRDLQRLYACGHSLEVQDYDGRTPLHLASAEGHIDTANFLLSHGHSTSIKDRWGFTPEDDAMQSGHDELIRLLKSAS
jgi:glutaminase